MTTRLKLYMAWDIDLPRRRASKPQNQLFRRSRLQLAAWYAGVMGVILTLLGFGMYRAIAHAHEVTIDREIKSVADALKNALKVTLADEQQLEQLPPQLLPDLCLADQHCLEPTQQTPGSPYLQSYYIRIISPTGKLLATAGDRPQGIPVAVPTATWQTVWDANDQHYHQVALELFPNVSPTVSLTAVESESWAYLVVGRSFQDFDEYLASVRWRILLGLLVALFLVAPASWWLATLAMRPIYRSYSQIQQFTADAAHELRTPLAAIRATVESVLRLPHLSEAEAQDTLGVIHRQNQRLSNLVSNLLLLSKLDIQSYPTKQAYCNLVDLIHDIAEEMAAFALQKQITLDIAVQTDSVVTILGDEENLYRLLLNLVNNALTYTPEGGRVTLTLQQQQQQALILVTDTGVGIAPGDQAKIFDRFYRVDTARSRQTGNSGLGLAIATAIAQAHRGTITVSSQLGKGSTFTVSLPISS
ncbi:ATP-binding protein [Leptothoe sp. LEGE 181152]|nr:ATP-binding protein [Leptothoe sp. LEGE 181152]